MHRGQESPERLVEPGRPATGCGRPPSRRDAPRGRSRFHADPRPANPGPRSGRAPRECRASSGAGCGRRACPDPNLESFNHRDAVAAVFIREVHPLLLGQLEMLRVVVATPGDTDLVVESRLGIASASGKSARRLAASVRHSMWLTTSRRSPASPAARRICCTKVDPSVVRSTSSATRAGPSSRTRTLAGPLTYPRAGNCRSGHSMFQAG